MYALKNAKIFTSEEVIENKILLIEGDKISKITSEENLDTNVQVIDLQGLNIAPSFIDIQIYGGGGSLYNSKTTEETIRKTYLEIRRQGTTHFQITLSSVLLGKMLEAIDVAKNYIKKYNELLASSTYFKKGTFNYYNAATIAKNLADTQPNLFFAVPRIWAKFREKILEKLPQKKLNLLLSIPTDLQLLLVVLLNHVIRYKQIDLVLYLP